MNNMFDSYDSINGSFNSCTNFPKISPNEKLEPCKPILPYEEYNDKGELIGYYWHYGDAITLEFNIEGEVTLLDNNLYTTTNDFMLNKNISIIFYDFRNTLIYQKDYSPEDIKDNPTKIIFDIDENLSKTLFLKGVYYCSFVIWDGDGLRKTLFSQSDAILTVR